MKTKVVASDFEKQTKRIIADLHNALNSHYPKNTIKSILKDKRKKRLKNTRHAWEYKSKFYVWKMLVALTLLKGMHPRLSLNFTAIRSIIGLPKSKAMESRLRYYIRKEIKSGLIEKKQLSEKRKPQIEILDFKKKARVSEGYYFYRIKTQKQVSKDIRHTIKNTETWRHLNTLGTKICLYFFKADNLKDALKQYVVEIISIWKKLLYILYYNGCIKKDDYDTLQRKPGQFLKILYGKNIIKFEKEQKYIRASIEKSLKGTFSI